MNTKKFYFFILLLLFVGWNKGLCIKSESIFGDTTKCIIEFELEQLGNGDYMVSLISDTTFAFPLNVVSNVQVTLKVPTGQFVIGEVTNLIDQVIFFETSNIEQPVEADQFDYLSISLGSQGTSNIPFQKGLKINLFTINNTQDCTDGVVSLMDNFTDPFFPPNNIGANVGQQLTVSGFRLADIPIGIIGDGIACNDELTIGDDLKLQIAKQNISCNGEEDGLIVAKGSGGTPVYSYLWNTGDTLSTIDGLSEGVYMVTLTDADGDTVSATVTLEEPPVLTLEINKTDISIVNAADGTATPIVNGGAAPYRFNWSNGSTDSIQTNLEGGIYTLILTDANGCEVSQSITLMPLGCLDIEVMLDMNAPNCVGDNTGSIDVIPLNGIAPFSFLWETGDTTTFLDSIVAGMYMVTVTDANGCIVGVTATLEEPAILSLEITKTDISTANAADGTATPIVNGGAAPYQFNWSNGSTDSIQTNLEGGIYTLILTDANGCEVSQSITLMPLGCLDIEVMLDMNVPNCVGDSTGSIDVTPLNGIAPFSFLWETGDTTTFLDSIVAGMYMVTVTDANGCIVPVTATLEEPAILSLEITKTDISTANAADGTATPIVSGGGAPYEFNWSNGSTDSVQTNLEVGTYTLILTNAKGCEVIESITLVTLDCPDIYVILDMNVPNCVGDSTGSLGITPLTGTGPFSFLWESGDTTAILDSIVAGMYMVTVTDANGCIVPVTATLEEPEILSLEITKTDISTANAADGTATPIVGGGGAPYEFNWSNGSTDSVQTNLEVGIYTLILTNAKGCEVTESITLVTLDCPDIDVMLDMNSPNCVGDSTGSLGITPLTGTAPFSFLWESGDTTAILDSIATGTYMVTVTDANGCTMAVSALLPDATPIVIELSPTDGATMGSGMITSNVSGGMPPYEYSWSNGSDNNSINNLISGVYDLTITDNKGCTQEASAVIDAQNCDLGILDVFGTELTLDTMSCFDNGEICLPIPLDSMVNYALFFDGASYMESIGGCQFDTLFAYTYFSLPGRGNSGPYVLEEWVVNETVYSANFPNIEALVDSMNLWDTQGNWILRSEIAIIKGGLPTNKYGEIRIRTPLTNSVTTLDLNTNLTPTGTLVEFESGSHELILINNSTTCSDTLTIFQPCTDSIDKDTLLVINLPIGEFDTLSLNVIFGNELRISENNCLELSGENASIELEESNKIVFVEALVEGSDDACFVIIDASGTVINVTIRVNVLPEGIHCESFILTDSFVVEITDCQDFEICAPLFYDSLLNYGVTDNGAVFTGIVSACDTANGTILSFPTPKIHNLIFTNSESCTDTVVIAINAPKCDEDLIIRDTIEVNDTDRSCIVLEGIPGSFQSVTDLCPEKNGEMVVMTIDGITGCIDYTGMELGVDTACIEVCDSFGFCDTILVIIVVSSGDLLPSQFEAVDDSTATSIDDAVVINALSNDTFGVLDDMYIVSQPENGIAVFNLDGTIRYMPFSGYCNDTISEMFDYAICGSGVCDTATVTVSVSCFAEKEFVIYSGLSPNGDGINDVFQIDGIENFPNNVVRVFNRWGNKVYEMAGYKNEWNGNWGKKLELLPDGTYFYLFDDGEGQMHSGFLEIRR